MASTLLGRLSIEHYFRKVAIAERAFSGAEIMLSDVEIVTNQTKYRELSKEYAELEPLVQNYVAYQAVLADIQAATLLAKDLDRDMREMAEEELRQGEARKGELESILAKLLLPRDPNDHKNVFLEIRAGAGGDEAAIFAGDLFRIYYKYSERQGWLVEIISANHCDHGG